MSDDAPYTYAPFNVPPPDPTIPTYSTVAGILGPAKTCDWCGALIAEFDAHKAFHDRIRVGLQVAQDARSEASRAYMQHEHWQGDGCWHHG